MSLKSNYEYIRDWANAKFLKKSDQIEVDLSNYPTKDEVEHALNTYGAWALTEPDSNSSSIVTKNGNCRAEGRFSIACGNDTYSAADYAFAEGCATNAFGKYSHSEGYSAQTDGLAAHAEGYDTNARNKGEHAGGNNNRSHQNSTTFGDSLNTTFSHGIGTSSYDSKNAIEIMENGDFYIYGLGGYDGKNLSSASTLQNVLTNVNSQLTNVVSQDQYVNDEEVIAAALNDLNTRINELTNLLNLRGYPVIDVSSDSSITTTSQGVDITSYAQASLTSDQFTALVRGQMYNFILKTSWANYFFGFDAKTNSLLWKSGSYGILCNIESETLQFGKMA